MDSALVLKLKALGCHEVVYPASVGRNRMIVPWSPESEWNGSDTAGENSTYYARYHHYNKGVPFDEAPANPERYSAGNYVDKRLAGDISPSLLPVYRHWIGPENGGDTWVPSLQDLQDLRLVKDPNSDNPVFITQILPLLNAASADTSGSGAGNTAGNTPTSGGTMSTATTTTTANAPSQLDISAMIASTIAAVLPALLQAEIARALPKGVTTPPAPAQPPSPASTGPSVAAVLSPLAAQAQSALNDLQHQVGEGGGHWAQVLRSLANAVVNTKQKFV